MAAPIAYSFLDVKAAISGPGGSFSLSGSGIADEGITVAMTDDKTSMITGADGYGMHSLHAAKSGRVTVRLLKNSPVNAMLMDMYNAQTVSASATGQNVITVNSTYWGDDFQCKYGAFVKLPDNVNAKDAGMMEWAFNFIEIDQKLGDGSLVI